MTVPRVAGLDGVFSELFWSVIAAWLTGRLHSYTWGIFITAQASLVAIPFFVVAFRRYRTDLARRELLLEGSTP